MSYNQNQNQNQNQDMYSQMSNMGEDAGKKIGKKASKKATKALAKAGKQVGKVATKVIMATLKALLPYILIGIGILLVVIMAYYILLEFRGTEQQYSYKYENTVEKSQNGYFVINGDLSYENKTIYQFYKYFSGLSYKQIVGNDNTKLIDANDEDAVEDYLKREKAFNLSPEMLFSLDEYMYQGRFKYPEQFIKPVYYDPDTLTLLSLTDEDGLVVVESEERDEDGKKTGNKIKSVRDYGIGSIFKYGEYERKLSVKGTYEYMDKWDASSNQKVKVEINEEFDLVMDDYPEDIYLIDKAITFVGEFEYEYETKPIRFEELKPGDTAKENEPYVKYHYDTYIEYYDCEVDEFGDEHCKTREHELYKYRSDESAVYETMPRPKVKEPETENNDKYLRDYLYNFETYVPQDVINDFDFGSRVGSFIETDFEIGEAINTKKFRKSLGYLDTITEMCDKYGIDDPYLIVAMMAQESGGDKNINKDGLMQVTGSSRCGTTKYGERVCIDTEGDEKLDPRTNIEMGVIEFKSRLDDFDGDVLKAIQSYNFGKAGLEYIKHRYPESWDSLDWLVHREEARAYYGDKYWGQPSRSADDNDPAKKNWPIYGDTHYLEHVLQYYKGENLSDLEDHDKDAPSKGLKGFFTGVANWFSSLITEREEEFENNDYVYHAKYSMVDSILQMAKAMTEKTLFSETNYDNMSFWEKGFISSIMTEGMSLEELMDLVPNADGYYPPTKIANPENYVSSRFGMRTLRGATRMHKGTDLGIPVGTKIYAIADGVVERASYDGDGYGYYVKLKHDDGTASVYAHFSDARWYGHSSSYVVKVGDRVNAGDLIGYSGNTGRSTGPHLHFEYHVNDTAVDSYYVLIGATNPNNKSVE